jgi:hypothetical protein
MANVAPFSKSNLVAEKAPITTQEHLTPEAMQEYLGGLTKTVNDNFTQIQQAFSQILTGTATTAAGVVTVTVGITMLNTNYTVIITAQDLPSGAYYVTNKTTTTFNINEIGAGASTYDWILIY